MERTETVEQLRAELRQHFPWSDFRPGQAQAIQQLRQGLNSLLILPTGGGKSLVFQFLARVDNRFCIVVVPLRALATDQEREACNVGVTARFIDPQRGTLAAFEDACRGLVNVLFVSPEYFVTAAERFEYIHRHSRRINLFVVDELHCCFQWGEFRPAYKAVLQTLHRFVDVPILACTATLERHSEQELLRRVPRVWHVFRKSVVRSGLVITVAEARHLLTDVQRVVTVDEPTVIFRRTRKQVVDLVDSFHQLRVRALAFHAGLPEAAKRRVLDLFTTDRCQLLVATVAFGLGMNKDNVGHVIHHGLPPSLREYYQEIGRAGRALTAARATLFYDDKAAGRSRLVRRRLVGHTEAARAGYVDELVVKQFALNRDCYWAALQQAFGETGTACRTQCSVCQAGLAQAPTDDRAEARTAVVAIAESRLTAGVKRWASVLQGARSCDATDRALPAFGVLAPQSFEWIQHLLERLVVAHVLVVRSTTTPTAVMLTVHAAADALARVEQLPAWRPPFARHTE